ncbi:TPA: hypothetical protein DCG86_03605 [Candidatus Marinimicrobia bacterium]|nr:MAG: hypothetical protein XD77_0333 [Marinimicrobia bacterium 46_47]KUK90312.1 MAG: hypothetical protein XE04_1519 [Marinimicrobia bacterium 46_43]HAE87091.1 hypothetical protein [Candidatus Neomarinimicrobiota bacterium]HBY19210.1 hypothetical protein [Candidatus Neomarinimicrobiota bacterium]
MKSSLENSLKVLAATLVSSLAGLFVTGTRIFDVSSQDFHFILAGFLIGFMWIPVNRLVKGGVVLGIFLVYKGLLAPPFTDFFMRDLIFFLIFFFLSWCAPAGLQRWKLSRPVSRFVFGGIVVALAYLISAVMIVLTYPAYGWDLGELVKVNALYGFTIGLAVELGFELVNLLLTVMYVRHSD